MLDWQKKTKKNGQLNSQDCHETSVTSGILLISNEIDPRLGWRFILSSDEGFVSSVEAQTHSRVSWAMYKMSQGLVFSLAMS